MQHRVHGRRRSTTSATREAVLAFIIPSHQVLARAPVVLGAAMIATCSIDGPDDTAPVVGARSAIIARNSRRRGPRPADARCIGVFRMRRAASSARASASSASSVGWNVGGYGADGPMMRGAMSRREIYVAI